MIPSPTANPGNRSVGATTRPPLVLVTHDGRNATCAAAALGALVGAGFGAAVGHGTILLPGFGFLDAGGTAVAAVMFGALGAAIVGLVTGLVENRYERPAIPPPMPSTGPGAMRSSMPDAPAHARRPYHSWVMQLPSYGAVLATAFMLYTLYVVASHGYGAGALSDQRARVTWNQKNVTRIGGMTDNETAPAAWAAATPGWDGNGEPPGAIHVAHDWRIALAATPLIARPSSATVIPDLRVPQPTPDPASAAAKLDADRGRTSRRVIVVAEDGDPVWALPAAAYAARTGTPILFVTHAAVPRATRAALARRRGSVAIVLLAPRSVVPDDVARELARYGRVDRVRAKSPERAAVAFAQFRDQAQDIGWGQTGRGRQRFADHASIIVNPARWEDAIAAAHLARHGKSGPLLYAEQDRMPAATDAYLWRLRPAYADTPEEGPYSHAWIVGSFSRIGYLPQAEADYAQEIEQYMTLGDSAVSGFEALAIAWIILALASAVWVWDNARTRALDVMPTMRAAWSCFTLLFGVIGIVMYVRSYNKRATMLRDGPHGPMAVWRRSTASRVISATVMMFGFDMLLMCLAVFAIGYVGYPIIRANNPLYWVGTSMFLMMVLMYVVALIVMLLVFHVPMTMHERGLPYWPAIRVGFPIVLATMSVESIGMMPTMWWAQMHFLPGMQMPTTDDITMWATLLMSVGVAFVVVLPFNYVMVRRGTKRGEM